MTRRRNTRQRQAIWDVLSEADRPLSPPEILAAARPRVHSLGIATVYRALKEMLQENLLVAVEVAGRPPRYERADLDHHHHFCCTLCNRVYELEGCLLAADVRPPRGFTVERHDVTLFGTCRDCRDAVS